MEEPDAGIPTSVWERLLADKRRLAAVVAATLVAVGLLGWAIARPLISADEDSPGRIAEDGSNRPAVPQDPGRSASPTDGSALTDTPTPDATASSDVSARDGAAPEIVPKRAKLIAYRSAGALWLAGEDGSGARKLVTAASGAFALSPDGGTLAYVDPATHRLGLYDISSNSLFQAQLAEDTRLAWSPGSDFLVYTAKGERYEVRRIGRYGSGDSFVGAGHSPAVDFAGNMVAYIASDAPGQSGTIALKDLSTLAEITLDGAEDASQVVFGGDGLVYAAPGSGAGQERIKTMRVDGSAPRVLVEAASSDKPVQYSSLCVSPDRSRLAYAAWGDDGYSRAFVLALADLRPVSLTVRRDTYPMCWSADGTCLFFVEGNAFQGEVTSVMRARTDGTGRVVVVAAGGL